MDVKGEAPIEACQRELREEGGFDVPVGGIIPLGATPISKAEDTVFFLFGARVQGHPIIGQRSRGQGDGSENEEQSYCIWADSVQMTVDPLAFMAHAKLQAYLEKELGERFVLEIREPNVNPEKKLEAAVGELQKALGFEEEHSKAEHSVLRETSTYPSLNELQDSVMEEGDSRFYRAYKTIARLLGVLTKALDDDLPFTMGGREFIDLKTGQPLTRAQWRRIEEEISRVFGWIFEDLPDVIVMQAMALGKVLSLMEVPQAEATPLKELRPRLSDMSLLEYTSALEYSKEAAASYVVDITDSARQKVRQTIINAVRGTWAPSQLEDELFENFSDLNRDWRMIAETELQYNFETGFLIGAVADAKIKGETHVLLLGHSSPTACHWCWEHINGKVFLLTESAPVGGGDTVSVGGVSYPAIWPGKNNIGRKKAQWWACVPAHPHCRCNHTLLPTANVYQYLDFEHGITQEKQKERDDLRGTFRE